MRLALWILLMAVATSSGCATHRDSPGGSALSPAQKLAIEDSVRRFVLDVAHDISQDGPAAWRKHFADSPSFFMAADGSLVFANSEAATQGIQGLAQTIKHIDLHWGDDVRVDALTPDFAVVATPWVEVLTDTAGHRVTESGFFTGLAENRNRQWQFRNAHWSRPVPPAKAP
jgi:hypothetical protein